MSTNKQITDKQRLLDLLVDGELSDGDRRELLAWCEREPDGWRRCAMAFLEAQDWSSVLGALTETSPQAAAVEQTARSMQATSAKTLARPTPFWNIRQWGTMLAMAASVVLAFTLGLWVRDAGKAGQLTPSGPPDVNVVSNGQRTASGAPVAGREGADADEWLPVDAAGVPDDVRQALERMGHHVEQQRRFVPYRLDDGRRMVIPVDQVEVRPVEIRNYQ
jgi:anti-sigma factor RsiW